MTEAEILAMLNVGSSKDVLKNASNSPLDKLLQDQCNEIVELLHKSMYKYDIDASNDLIANTNPTTLKRSGDVIEIGISSFFYWKFVNFGVNGSLVNRGAPNWSSIPQSGTMSQAMKKWQRDRGIVVNKGVSNWTSKSKVAGMNMIERGQIARPFYTDVVNEKLANRLREQVKDLVGNSIRIIIKDPWQ